MTKHLGLWLKTFLPLWLAGGALGFAVGFFLVAPAIHDVPRGIIASLSCVVGAFIGGTLGYRLADKSRDRSN